MLLSPALLAELADEIRRQHLGYATQILGVAALGLTQDVYEQLVQGGLVQPDEVENHVLAAYRAGHVQAWHDTRPGKPTPGHAIKTYAAATAAGMPPLTSPQQYAVQFASERAAQYVLGLGNRVANDFVTLAIETETETRNEVKGKIADALTESIIYRETARKLASRIGDATGDWSRDLHRIAVTELEFAYQNGWADYIEENVGADARVFKRVNADACDTCKRLLTVNGKPRTFTLAELRDNGTNFGEKQKDWKPVVGPLHPRCHCVLAHLPAGFGFNDAGQMLPLSVAGVEAA